MEFTCIMCPMGCSLKVEKKGDEVVVTGNTCKRGEMYGKQEFVAPKRVVTSLVRIAGGGVVSVKTSDLVVKNRIFDVLDLLKTVEVKKPIHIGDVIVKDALKTGVDVVATGEKL